MKFKDSALAHQLLDNLFGIEIGASAHNPFNLPGSFANVDDTDDMHTIFKQEEMRMCNETAKVDIVASAEKLPIENNSLDYVINSHVLEHMYNPIQAIQEWLRVVRPGGYVYMIVPHKERTFDALRPRTTLSELLERNTNPKPEELAHEGHKSVWITEDLVELCQAMKWNIVQKQDTDDKVGNGFTIVIKKGEAT